MPPERYSGRVACRRVGDSVATRSAVYAQSRWRKLGMLPFLELLVLQLRSQGIRRVVMCTGYLADQIEEEFGDGR